MDRKIDTYKERLTLLKTDLKINMEYIEDFEKKFDHKTKLYNNEDAMRAHRLLQHILLYKEV